MYPQFFTLLQFIPFPMWLLSFFHQEVASTQTPLNLGLPCDMLWPIDCNGNVKPGLYKTSCASDFSFWSLPVSHEQAQASLLYVGTHVARSLLLSWLTSQPASRNVSEAILTSHTPDNTPAEHMCMNKQ